MNWLRHAFAILLPCCLASALCAQQYKLRGVVSDATTGETLIGANVLLKGTTTGAVTDVDGRFELLVNELPPYTLVISYIGYNPLEVEVKSLDKELKFKLSTDLVLLGEAEVIGSRIKEKQKQAALTVESMDVIAIREAPSGSFYESLGTLKGVDMTAASMGFKVINTRGFNSTSPVRSLQLIDGVDNQSPGLNFSLGNFLGASDLDVMKVDIIAGASSAYFGPGAFNGVINMTTKSPWAFQGLSFSVKGGERSMLEGAVRYAHVIKDKDGKDRWAYKVNAFAMRAEDWYAENYDATSASPTGTTNPGRYDGVNSYGDENVTVNNDFSKNMFDRRQYPGLGLYLRPGYKESDLVDYGTHNIKLGGALHYRITDGDSVKAPVEVVLASNFSTGSTVYQGDNRYRLQDVMFFQHKVEVKEEGKWFLRGYVTHEDAGNTYDIFTTALRMQEAGGSTKDWNTKYFTLWETWIKPQINQIDPGFITVQEAPGQGITTAEAYDNYIQQYVLDNNTLFTDLHQQVVDSINTIDSNELNPAYLVGTAAFDQKFNEVTGKRFTEGGSKFFDRSVLAHAMGEYRFKPTFGEVVVGGNFRQYLPNSAGTIFKDTGNVVIRNSEFGVYSGLEKKFMNDELKATVTVRMDKNQNFNALIACRLIRVHPAPGPGVPRVLQQRHPQPHIGRPILLLQRGACHSAGQRGGRVRSGPRQLDHPRELRCLPDQPDPVGRPEQVGLLQRGPASSRAGEDLGAGLPRYRCGEVLPGRWRVQQLVQGFHRLHHRAHGFLRPDHRLPQRPASSLPSCRQCKPAGDHARREHRVELLPPEGHVQRELQLQQAAERLGRSDHPGLQHAAEQVQCGLHRARHAGALHRPAEPGLRSELEVCGRLHLRRLTAVHRSDPHL